MHITSLAMKDQRKSSYVFDFTKEDQRKTKQTEDEKEKVEEVLFLLDRFCVQIILDLAKGYKMKRVRNAVNAATNTDQANSKENDRSSGTFHGEAR